MVSKEYYTDKGEFMDKIIDFLIDGYTLIYIALPIIVSIVCAFILYKKKNKTKTICVFLSIILTINFFTVCVGAFNCFRKEFVKNDLVTDADIQLLTEQLSNNEITEIFPYDNTAGDYDNEGSNVSYNKRLSFPCKFFIHDEVPIYSNNYIDVIYTSHGTLEDATKNFNDYVLDFNEQSKKTEKYEQIIPVNEGEFFVAVSPIDIYHPDYLGTIRMEKTYSIAIMHKKETYIFTENSTALGFNMHLSKMIQNEKLFEY